MGTDGLNFPNKQDTCSKRNKAIDEQHERIKTCNKRTQVKC